MSEQTVTLPLKPPLAGYRTYTVTGIRTTPSGKRIADAYHTDYGYPREVQNFERCLEIARVLDEQPEQMVLGI